jgi:hypothetical protein
MDGFKTAGFVVLWVAAQIGWLAALAAGMIWLLPG